MRPALLLPICLFLVGDAQARASAKPLLTFKKHKGAIADAAWSPDGTRVVSTGADHTVKLWDASSGKLARTLGGFSNGHDSPPPEARFAPDGPHLLTIDWGDDPSVVTLWDAATGSQVATLADRHRAYGAAFDGDGGRLVVWGVEGASTWDVASARQLASVDVASGRLNAASLRRDGARLAVAADDGGARIYDAATGKQLASVAPDGTFVAFTPDGTRLLVATGGAAGVWDADGTKQLATLERADEVPPDEWRFSADGTHAAATTPDGKKTLVWDLATGKVVATLAGVDQEHGLALSADGTHAALATGSSVTWADVASSHATTFRGKAHVTAVALSPDGTRLLAAQTDGTMLVWKLP